MQRAIEIMQAHGLDPMGYGFICYDKWDAMPEVWQDEPEERDAEGTLIQEASRILVQPAREAGDRCGYHIAITCNTSNPDKVLTLKGILPVNAQ